MKSVFWIHRKAVKRSIYFHHSKDVSSINHEMISLTMWTYSVNKQSRLNIMDIMGHEKWVIYLFCLQVFTLTNNAVEYFSRSILNRGLSIQSHSRPILRSFWIGKDKLLSTKVSSQIKLYFKPKRSKNLRVRILFLDLNLFIIICQFTMNLLHLYKSYSFTDNGLFYLAVKIYFS